MVVDPTELVVRLLVADLLEVLLDDDVEADLDQLVTEDVFDVDEAEDDLLRVLVVALLEDVVDEALLELLLLDV